MRTSRSVHASRGRENSVQSSLGGCVVSCVPRFDPSITSSSSGGVHSELPCLARGDPDFLGHRRRCFPPADEMLEFPKYLSNRIALASVERCRRRYWLLYLDGVLSLTNCPSKFEVGQPPGVFRAVGSGRKICSDEEQRIENGKTRRMNEEVADEVGTVALSKCTEKDVLLGRGNRNNAWPGNIHFRNVAMKYRDEYNKVNRCQKVEIALKVINEITASGGRFVQVDHDAYNCSSTQDMYCFEVDRARSIEKTCQVLREKVSSKYKPLKTIGENREANALSSRDVGDESVRSRFQENNNNSESVALSSDRNDDTSRLPDIDSHQQEAKRSKSIFCTDEMLRRLRCFQSKYGHANVPPNWSHDIVLADWCCVQRQLYRESQSGCWSPSTTEGIIPMPSDDLTKLFEDLNAIHFAWDYDEWHWNHWHSQWVAQKDGVEPSRPSVNVWIRDQRRKYQMGILSAERANKLKQAGIILW